MSSPTKYPHLNQDVQQAADLDDFERVMFILKGVYIFHPQVVRIHQFVEHLIRMPRQQRPTGIVLCADSDLGKSSLFESIVRKYPEYVPATGGGRRLPVLLVEMTEKPDPRQMWRELIHAAGIPNDLFTKETPLHVRLSEGLAALETKIVMIDEFPNIMNADNPKVMVTWLKSLSNKIKRPIIIAGDDRIFVPLREYQMHSRFPFTLDLPMWSDTAELQMLLNAWQRMLPLRRPSDLTSTAMRRKILDESGGALGQIAKCLTHAAVAAIRLGSERVEKEHLEWWRDPPLITDPDTAESTIARAWLADERKKPNPLLLTVNRLSLLEQKRSKRKRA
jgi:hypothetical protein